MVGACHGLGIQQNASCQHAHCWPGRAHMLYGQSSSTHRAVPAPVMAGSSASKQRCLRHTKHAACNCNIRGLGDQTTLPSALHSIWSLLPTQRWQRPNSSCCVHLSRPLTHGSLRLQWHRLLLCRHHDAPSPPHLRTLQAAYKGAHARMHTCVPQMCVEGRSNASGGPHLPALASGRRGSALLPQRQILLSVCTYIGA